MKRHRTGVITVPIFRSGIIPLANLLDAINPHSKKTYLITGNDGFQFFRNYPGLHIDGWIYPNSKNSVIIRLLRYFWTQIIVSFWLLARMKNIDNWIFFFGYYRLILPLFIAKIFRKRIFILIPDFIGHLLCKSNNHISTLQNIQLKTVYALADRIIIYSPRFMKQWGLEKYKKKILIGHEHFLDMDNYKITIPLSQRSEIIGFIGRFNCEKGICEFIQSLPIIISEHPELNVLLVGDGPLKAEIIKYIDKHKLYGQIELTGWIPHEKLPNILNRLKLLVIPSYTEGLPNIVLESMICGTPVLATPVGAIPDIIQEGETGFIMETNTPNCISDNVIRALKSPVLNEIADKGRLTIKEKYSFEKTTQQWGIILKECGK